MRKNWSQFVCGIASKPTERSAILGKGNLTKARKDITAKDEQIAQLNEQIKKLQAECSATIQRHQQELAKLRNGYQVEINKAIKEVESLRKAIQSKEARIELQSRRIYTSLQAPLFAPIPNFS